MRGKCAAIAPVTVQTAAKMKASSTMVRSSGRCGFAAALACLAPLIVGSKKKLSGRPISILAAAQAKQVSRQPIWARPQAVSGQPTVDAKPAISVMPVIGFVGSGPVGGPGRAGGGRV